MEADIATNRAQANIIDMLELLCRCRLSMSAITLLHLTTHSPVGAQIKC